MSRLYSWLGVVISTLCALVLAKLFAGTELKLQGPVLFTIALVILSSHFGAEISVAGSLLAAGVFAFVLYSPENSLQVAKDSERSTLGWMVLVSISLSYLLYPTRSRPTAGESSNVPTRGEDREIGNAPGIGSAHEIGNGPEIGGSRTGGTSAG